MKKIIPLLVITRTHFSCIADNVQEFSDQHGVARCFLKLTAKEQDKENEENMQYLGKLSC